jgi:Flp pilus assembly protein TadG
MKFRRLEKENKGTALVEFAIIALLLFTLVFGIIEFGLMAKDNLALSQAARAGARIAAIGKTPDDIKTATISQSIGVSHLTASNISVTTGAPGTNQELWAALGVSASTSQNDAAVGNLIRVRVTYNHNLITKLFFGNSNSITLHGDMIVRREGSK